MRVKGEGLFVDEIAEAVVLEGFGFLGRGAPGGLFYQLYRIRVLWFAALQQRVVPGTYGQGKVVDESVRTFLRYVDDNCLSAFAQGFVGLPQCQAEVLHIAGTTVEEHGVIAILPVIGIFSRVDFHIEAAFPGYCGHTFGRLYAVRDAYAVAVFEKLFEKAASTAY